MDVSEFTGSVRPVTSPFRSPDIGECRFMFVRAMPRHQKLAAELGATWVGSAAAEPPVKLDGSIVFAPAGELVPPALRALDKASTLVLGGIHMSDIPSFPYDLLYHERVIRSVANNTRQDGKDFLKLAASIPIRTKVEVYPLLGCESRTSISQE